MKTRPFLKLLPALTMIVLAILLVKCKVTQKSRQEQITDFLSGFNKAIKQGNADSIKAYFENGGQGKANALFLSLLVNKPAVSDPLKPVKDISLDVDSATFNDVNDAIVLAHVPVTLNVNNRFHMGSQVTLSLHAAENGGYKISVFDAKKLLTDYAAYTRNYKIKQIDENKVFTPVTLAAFRAAQQLKARYDSVLWFQHIADKSWFYVIKGHTGDYFYWDDDNPDKVPGNYKMGLVNPDLKEIIPVAFDMVHNIGGTIDGMIEVEKGGLKGLYDTRGKLIVPAKYDNIFPLNDEENTALLRLGNDYFYLTKDLTITPKTDVKITEVLPKIKSLGHSYKMSDTTWKNIMESNDRDDFNSVVVTPSYLVDLHLLPKFMIFQNPTRHFDAEDMGEGNGSVSVKVNYDGGEKKDDNWFESLYYSFVDDYLGARSGLYEEKKMIVVDKRKNQLMGFSARSYYGGAEGGGALEGDCNENSLRTISDSLFEFKTTSALDFPLYDKSTVDEGPYYHYLRIKNGKLESLPAPRMFSCTKYVKLDDSFLSNCFRISGKSVDHVTPGILQYMKNEIYASYGYIFKDPRWTEVFYRHYGDPKTKPKTNPEDSLSAIERYNVSWINQKLKAMKPGNTTLAAK